jgi:hypothetical protein
MVMATARFILHSILLIGGRGGLSGIVFSDH